MRETTDLLELEFTFSQQLFCSKSLLPPKDLIAAFEKRVLPSKHEISLDWEQLEELHRIKLLIPFFRFEKNVRFLRKQALNTKQLAKSVYLDKDTDFLVSHHGKKIGSLKDPCQEKLKTWYSYVHSYNSDYFWKDYSEDTGKISYYWASSFLYSPYQLLLIPKIRKLLEKIKKYPTNRKYSSRNLRYRLTIKNEYLKNELLKAATENRDLATALTALEPIYVPSLKGHWFSAIYSGFDPYIEKLLDYQHSFNPIKMLEWLGWDSNRVRELAKKLLWQADKLDPLRDWYEIVRMSHPDMLNNLRGDALIALDHRRAAEILLRFYEDLIRHGAAPPLPEVPPLARGPYDRRLKYDLDSLDSVLMKFGLSPQPSLVLIIEGETEEYIVPKVMNFLGVPQQSNFIQVFSVRGIEKDIELLARYIAPPKLKLPIVPSPENDMLELERPATHFFVLVDAEKDYETAISREEKRLAWVDRIYEAMPQRFQTVELKNSLSPLVSIETWNDKVFEFAHFSSREIATAIIQDYRNHKGSLTNLLSLMRAETEEILLAKLERSIDNLSPNGNIEKSIMKRWDYAPSKVQLAKILWPSLETKIRNAHEHENIESVPVVNAILKVQELAIMNHRRNVVMRY